MQIKKKQYDVQGLTFQIVPTTRNNVKRVMNYFDENEGEIEIDDTFDAWFTVFTLVTAPVGDHTHDDVDVADFDQKIGEDALVSFLPTLTTTLNGLVGS